MKKITRLASALTLALALATALSAGLAAFPALDGLVFLAGNSADPAPLKSKTVGRESGKDLATQYQNLPLGKKVNYEWGSLRVDILSQTPLNIRITFIPKNYDPDLATNLAVWPADHGEMYQNEESGTLIRCHYPETRDIQITTTNWGVQNPPVEVNLPATAKLSGNIYPCSEP
jgi:hypothetical protein